MLKNIVMLVILVAAFSCKDNEDDNYTGHNPCSETQITSYLTSLDLLNCRYKTGTYWIFIDSVNNTADSLCVSDVSWGFLQEICGNVYENYIFSTFSYPSNTFIDYIIVSGGVFKGYNGNIGSGIEIYDDYNAVSLNDPSKLPIDSIFIYDRYYKKVLRYTVERDPTEENKESIYYMNSEYGFLRQDIFSDSILITKRLLKDKHIIR